MQHGAPACRSHAARRMLLLAMCMFSVHVAYCVLRIARCTLCCVRLQLSCAFGPRCSDSLNNGLKRRSSLRSVQHATTYHASSRRASTPIRICAFGVRNSLGIEERYLSARLIRVVSAPIVGGMVGVHQEIVELLKAVADRMHKDKEAEVRLRVLAVLIALTVLTVLHKVDRSGVCHPPAVARRCRLYCTDDTCAIQVLKELEEGPDTPRSSCSDHDAQA